MFLTILGASALIALILVVVVVRRLCGRRLPSAAKKKFLMQWESLGGIDDVARRVLEADSILDKALSALGYEGSLGEKFKKAGPRFSDLNAVWSAHKLRNQIAHEPGMHVPKEDSDRAVSRLRHAFDDLC